MLSNFGLIVFIHGVFLWLAILIGLNEDDFYYTLIPKKILPYLERGIKVVGSKICKIRQEKGISQSQLARRCGTAVSNIHNIESGVSKNPGWYTICKIAKALNVEITEFLE